jgi:hypothetical protein
VESLSTKVERLQWGRNKVLELSSPGTQSIRNSIHIACRLGTISRDILFLREQARDNLKTHINDKLPEEYQSCMAGLKQVLKLSWDIADKSKNYNNDNSETATITDDKTRLQALALANDCYKYIMDLTTNGVVITDAIKFVQTNKEKLTMSSKEQDKESKEPDYDEDKNQLEEKTGQPSEQGKTTNQVF